MRATQVVVGPGPDGLLEAKALLEDVSRCRFGGVFRCRGDDGTRRRSGALAPGRWVDVAGLAASPGGTIRVAGRAEAHEDRTYRGLGCERYAGMLKMWQIKVRSNLPLRCTGIVWI